MIESMGVRVREASDYFRIAKGHEMNAVNKNKFIKIENHL